MNRAFLLTFAGAAFGLGGCDADDVEPIEGVGVVVASSGTATSQSFARYRRFERPRPRCPGAVDFGSCSFFDCYLPVGEEIALAEPGVVTITGGSRDIELTPDTNYDEPAADTPLFEGGETLTFEVEGGEDIEPHRATVVAPSPLAISEPVLSEPIEIDRLADFPATWTGGNGQYVQVALTIEQVLETEVRRVELACQYDPDATRVYLPTSLMRSLPLVTDPAEAALSIGAWNSQDGDVRNWLYAFYATASESVPVTLK